MFLSEYDSEIKHIKRKENDVADTFSHHPNLLYPRNNFESNLENKILNAEKIDKEYKKPKEKTA